MRLTTNQRKVILASQLAARDPVSEIAKRCGLRQHTVRQTLEGLLRNNIIRPLLVVNVFALGFDDYGIFIRRITESEKERKQFIDYLKRSPRVSWLAELGGSYQYVMAVMARGSHEIDHFLKEIGGNIGQVIKGRTFAPRIGWEMYTSKYLLPSDRIAKTSIVAKGVPTLPDVDELDLKILKTLSQQPDAAYSVIARALSIPNSSLQYRIERLKADGIILGFAYHMNYDVLGLRKSLLLVYERGSDSKFAKEFEEYCRQHPAVTTCHRALADWNYELDIHTESGDQLAKIRQDILEKFGSSITEIENLEYLITHKLVPYPGHFISKNVKANRVSQ